MVTGPVATQFTRDGAGSRLFPPRSLRPERLWDLVVGHCSRLVPQEGPAVGTPSDSEAFWAIWWDVELVIFPAAQTPSGGVVFDGRPGVERAACEAAWRGQSITGCPEG